MKRVIDYLGSHLELNYDNMTDDERNAFKTAIQTLYREIPMPIIIGNKINDSIDVYCCRCGKNYFIHKYDEKPEYCSKCGQHFDWGEL